MTLSRNELPTYTYHYFLDEAGDPTFFGKGKKIIIGQPGVSSCFILGMVKFNTDLNLIASKIVELQKRVVEEPYFLKVGSINKKRERILLSCHG